MKARASFTKADVKRAIDAVEAAGKTVAAVDFPVAGGFRIVVGELLPSATPANAINEWDDVLPK